jgi:hypothetical protein
MAFKMKGFSGFKQTEGDPKKSKSEFYDSSTASESTKEAFAEVVADAERANKYNEEQKAKGSTKRMTGSGNIFDLAEE